MIKLRDLLKESIEYFDNVKDAEVEMANRAYKQVIFYDKLKSKYFLVFDEKSGPYRRDKNYIYVPSEREK